MANTTTRRRLAPLLVALVAAASWGCRHAAPPAEPPLTYPHARTVDVVDTYHGVRVPDPYRWLEDLDSPETRAWVEAENRLTEAYLARIPQREAIRRRLEALWSYERYGTPWHAGGRFFWFHNPGLEPQSVLVVADAPDAPGRVLLDPNALSEDGTVAVSRVAVSWNGEYLAYALSSGGSDWQEWHVRRVDTGEDLPDVVRWSKFAGAAWAPDDSGFYYARYDEPAPGAELEQVNRSQKLYFHRLGSDQSDDVLVYHRPDRPEWGFSPEVTEDGRWLVIEVSRGTDRRTTLLVLDLRRPEAEPVPLTPEFEAGYAYVGNDGDTFYLWTDDRERGRIVAARPGVPPEGWREVVPEGGDALRSAALFGDTLVLEYLHDASSRVVLAPLDGGAPREVDLPGIGSARGFTGLRADRETFFSFASFARPSTVYRLDIVSGAVRVLHAPDVPFDPDDYVTERVFYRSTDGTRVPLFLTRRRDVTPSPETPVLLYGYGGFDIALTPRFSVPNLVWMEMGGIYAQACLRGGSEYGEAWHRAGMLANKQNVFDDFIAAAEWLIGNGYTSRGKLAIAGASNGGLLVGAVLDQRPDLFGAALPAVGVMDMLRFHRFTIGWAWTSEYGSPDDPEMFPVLYRYSPYHNITPGTCYPPTLVTTADHDDRVVPAHSFKYAARLQAAQGCANPVLIRIETRAGHGAGKPVTKRIEEAADRLAFLVKALGMEVAP